jgi:hypothetical protein
MRTFMIVAVMALTACQTKDVGTADSTAVIGDTVTVPKDTLVVNPTDTTFVKPDSTKL